MQRDHSVAALRFSPLTAEALMRGAAKNAGNSTRLGRDHLSWAAGSHSLKFSTRGGGEEVCVLDCEERCKFQPRERLERSLGEGKTSLDFQCGRCTGPDPLWWPQRQSMRAGRSSLADARPKTLCELRRGLRFLSG